MDGSGLDGQSLDEPLSVRTEQQNRLKLVLISQNSNQLPLPTYASCPGRLDIQQRTPSNPSSTSISRSESRIRYPYPPNLLEVVVPLKLIPSLVQRAENRSTDHALLRRGVLRDLAYENMNVSLLGPHQIR